ncbi:MAG: ABC transporter permease [Caldilineaceae bacterium]|nr:ABC transporter permease [Caldilineaceae bacterium]
MLPPRWYKVISDLWSNRTRTVIVALAVAVGVYAVGSVLSVQTVMLREFHADRDAAAIAHAIIRTQPFDEKLAERISELPGVAAAEGRRTLFARILTGPTSTRDILFEAMADFDDQQVDRYVRVAGEWPTRKDEVMLEWMGPAYLNAEIGDTITVELSDNSRKTLTITGTAHNARYPSPDVLGFTQGVIAPETLTYLGQNNQFTELRLRVVGDGGEDPDDDTVRSVARTVEKQFENTGRTILDTTIVGESIIESIVNTAVLILSAFGWVILLLSAFLVVNTITALIGQQINQIGIMKLVGAGRSQIAGMYLVLVLVYGLIAIALGIPLSVGTMYLLMTRLVEGLVNLRTDSYAVPLWAYATMVGVGLLIPVAAGLLPVWQGTRVTCFAALNDVGIRSGGQGGLERTLLRVPQGRVERPLILAIRNALRHKSRLLRTVIVLTLGTTLYIAVISVRASVDTTLHDFLRYHQYDVQVEMTGPQRIARLEAVATGYPDVQTVEAWGMASATRLRPDGSESNRYQVIGLPEDTELVTPVLQSGRWLTPADGDAVAINATVADQERDLRPGDPIVLDMAGHERTYTIVGIVTTDAQGAKLYMNLRPFGEASRSTGKAMAVQVVTHDPDGQTQLAEQLLRDYETAGMDVYTTRTTQTLNAQNQLMFDTIIGFLILMASLLGAVGTLGLSTTMSINMTERVREIGVMRAIGASNRAIRRVVLVEGVAIALLSWAMGFVLSFPAARLISAQIGIALLDMPLSYTYSMGAAVFWLGVLLLLAVVASLGPAQRAVRLTVREVLAYE